MSQATIIRSLREASSRIDKLLACRVAPFRVKVKLDVEGKPLRRRSSRHAWLETPQMASEFEAEILLKNLEEVLILLRHLEDVK